MPSFFRFFIVLLCSFCMIAPSADAEEAGEPSKPETKQEKIAVPELEEDSRDPEISTDLSALPFPVRRMRELLLEVSQSGDIEGLRRLIGVGETSTELSLGSYEGDPIEFLKSESGDPDGHELLAILSEVLEAGYAHLDAGTENELYIWPYFFVLPLEELNDKQRVELFRLVTYGDYLDMKDFGSYIFYRVGITPTGRWTFFVTGD